MGDEGSVYTMTPTLSGGDILPSSTWDVLEYLTTFSAGSVSPLMAAEYVMTPLLPMCSIRCHYDRPQRTRSVVTDRRMSSQQPQPTPQGHTVRSWGVPCACTLCGLQHLGLGLLLGTGGTSSTRPGSQLHMTTLEVTHRRRGACTGTQYEWAQQPKPHASLSLRPTPTCHIAGNVTTAFPPHLKPLVQKR